MFANFWNTIKGKSEEKLKETRKIKKEIKEEVLVIAKENKKTEKWILTVPIDDRIKIIMIVDRDDVIVESIEEIKKLYRCIKNLDDDAWIEIKAQGF